MADIERQAPQATVFAGDLALGGPEPEACVVRVRATIGIQCIRGNTDEFFAEDRPAPDDPLTEWTRRRLQPGARAWLANRPFEHRIDDLLVVHAAPWSITDIIPKNAGVETLRRVLAQGRAAAVAYGHIHQGWIGEVPGTGIVVNAGSVGVPFDGDPRASYALLERGPSGWMAELRRVAYDIERTVAAFPADHPARAQWGTMIRTGRRS